MTENGDPDRGTPSPWSYHPPMPPAEASDVPIFGTARPGAIPPAGAGEAGAGEAGTGEAGAGEAGTGEAGAGEAGAGHAGADQAASQPGRHSDAAPGGYPEVHYYAHPGSEPPVGAWAPASADPTAHAETPLSSEPVSSSQTALPFEARPPSETVPASEPEPASEAEPASDTYAEDDALTGQYPSAEFGSPFGLPPVPNGAPQYAQPPYDPARYAPTQNTESHYGQPEYAQPQYGQNQYGQSQSGQNQYGQNQSGQNEYGQNQSGQNQSAPSQYGQAQYRQPQDTPPQYGQPQYGEPHYGQPQDAQSQYGQPQDAQSQYGQPQDAQSQYGQPQDAQSQYGQPQDAQSQYGQAQYGQPQDAQSQYGQSQYGQPQDAQAQYGQPQHSPPQFAAGPSSADQSLPVASQPVASQPVASQPVSAQPVSAQPVSAQPGQSAPVQYASNPGAPNSATYAGAPRPTSTPQTAPARDQGPGVPPPSAQPRPESLLVPSHRAAASHEAQGGWQGRVRRLSGGVIKPQPSAQELADRRDAHDIQRSFSRPMTIVVVQPKGGAGKTPATIGLASALGAHRGGYVVGWDDNETRGTLAVRVDNADHQTTTVWDLLRDLPSFERNDARVGDMSHYVRGQGAAQFDALVSDDSPGNMAQIGEGEFHRIHAVLQRFYRQIVIDTGNNVRSPNWQAAVNAADQIVIVSTYSRDVGYSGSWVLDHLIETGRAELAASAITVLSAADPRQDMTVRSELIDHFRQRTRTVVEIPYDPLIALGGPIEWTRLKPETRRAWTHAGAAVVNALAAQDEHERVVNRN